MSRQMLVIVAQVGRRARAQRPEAGGAITGSLGITTVMASVKTFGSNSGKGAALFAQSATTLRLAGSMKEAIPELGMPFEVSMNLPEILDKIWKSRAPRTTAAKVAALELDKSSQIVIQALCSFVLGQSTLAEFESALSRQDAHNGVGMTTTSILGEETFSVLAGLQLARDHLDAVLFKPVEERNQWFSSSARELNLSLSDFKRLLEATTILERKELLRHASSN